MQASKQTVFKVKICVISMMIEMVFFCSRLRDVNLQSNLIILGARGEPIASCSPMFCAMHFQSYASV